MKTELNYSCSKHYINIIYIYESNILMAKIGENFTIVL